MAAGNWNVKRSYGGDIDMKPDEESDEVHAYNQQAISPGCRHRGNEVALSTVKDNVRQTGVVLWPR